MSRSPLPALWLAATLCAVVHAAPKIAIFSEEGFPYYMASEADSPARFQELYRGIGLTADLLDTAALADPARFNVRDYPVYVHPYGNTFPVEALPNLVAFHAAGGIVVIPSGVPFCHPADRRGAAGWAMELAGDSGRVVGVAHTGAACLRIHNTHPDNWTGPASARMPAKPGDSFRVGGWVKLERDLAPHDKNALYLRFFNAAGTFIGQSGPAFPTAACDWTRLEREVTVPEGAATLDVSPQLWSPDGRILVDDLFLLRPGSAENLLANPSFEQGGGEWVDLGHEGKYQTHEQGLGTGGFLNVSDPGGFVLSALGRKIGLDAVDWSLLPDPDFAQPLDPASLAPEDEVLPLVSAGAADRGVFPAVMIRHHCRRFDGAIDVWGRSHCDAISQRAMYHVVLKATVAALGMKGLVSEPEAAAMVVKVNATVPGRERAWEPVTEPRPFDTPWPHSTRPADTILVCDVSEVPPEREFALAVLQGLVNRSQPRLYLVHSRYARQDRQWLEELVLEGLKTREVSPEEAWRTFAGVAKGRLVYDRAIMKEIGAYHADRLNLTNIILMLCAVNDAVPEAVDGDAAPPEGLPVVLDTRGRWQTPQEMYSWAYETLWPRMNHHILASLYPGIFYLTDYLVEHRIFTFWFPSQRSLKEQDLLEQILASTPPNTPIVGWWFDWMPNVQDPNHAAADCVGEGEGVRLGSLFGKFLTVSHEATNLSLHSGMPLLGLKHKPVAGPAKLDRTKVYYSFLMSDGDNLGEALMMRTRDLHWAATRGGTVPMGWSFAPATAVLAPPVLNYYLRSATEADYLVGGLGIAYTQPDAYATAFPKQRDAIFAGYARMTADSLAPLDTGALWLIGGSKANVSRYAAAGAPLRCIFPDYGSGMKRPYPAVTYTDQKEVSVFRAVTGWGGDADYTQRLVREIRDATEGVRPAFVHAFLLNWGTSIPMLEEVRKRLGDGYVCVRPDELDRLYREAR